MNQFAKTVFLICVVMLFGAGSTVAFQRVILNDGDLNSPSLTFGNDLHTGVYRSDAGTIGFVVEGHDSMWVLDGANASVNVSSNNVAANGVAMCLTATPSNCDLTATSGLYIGDGFIWAVNSADPDLVGSLQFLSDPFTILGRPSSTTLFSLDTAATAGTLTGSLFVLPTLVVGVSTGVSGSASSIQTNGTITSASPMVPFSIGPTAAFTAGLKLGSFKCTQRCKITKAWTKVLAAGSGGTTAPTVTVTDGSGTCTLTSGSGCNVAGDTDNDYTTSGTCTFAAGTRLNVTGVRGNCTVGPSFYDLGIETNNQ